MKHKQAADVASAAPLSVSETETDVEGLVAPTDPRNPGNEFLQREIDENRRSEFWLIPKAVLALAVVAVLVVIREVFFR
ncbi:hypothetical protein F1C58_04540 [Glaciihabitans sp. INWT7]|uniref:hypothetical protein n=1 Tax=Glaciihabitans sp. INWT7 TaxID=2596912 RepID=UPI001624F282|nr:hypothetical protein [Glaciihabitans sp. INWT7]QNE46248.1 hypothetical protein F1C58_04540 [Glaciihabitans sp. INWT7]